MRSSLLRIGCLPTLGAVWLLMHPPAMAETIILPGAFCGSKATVEFPVGRGGGRSRDDNGPCAAGCHATGPVRKRELVPGDRR